MVVREEEELGSEVGVLNRLASKAQEALLILLLLSNSARILDNPLFQIEES